MFVNTAGIWRYRAARNDERRARSLSPVTVVSLVVHMAVHNDGDLSWQTAVFVDHRYGSADRDIVTMDISCVRTAVGRLSVVSLRSARITGKCRQ